MRWAAESTMTLTFEFHGQLLRLSGAREQQLPVAAPLTLQAALDQLAESRPELAAVLGRCACAIGDRLILRRELLQADTRIALLPPAARSEERRVGKGGVSTCRPRGWPRH